MAKSVEEIYAEARKMIGTKGELIRGRYPVEFEPIRRYCHMVDDANPLFLDPEYSKRTRYGGVICPPLLIWNFGIPGRWPPTKYQKLLNMPAVPTPGDKGVNLTTEWEFLKPVRIGDRISSQSQIRDVFMKPTRLDPQTFWIRVETAFTNQNGEVVAIWRNLNLRHRSKEQIAEATREGT